MIPNKEEIDKDVLEWCQHHQDIVEKINNTDMKIEENNIDVNISNFTDNINKLIEKSKRYHKEFADEIKGNNT